MKRHIWLAAALAGLVVAPGMVKSQEHHQLKLDVSALLDVDKLFAFTPETLEKTFASDQFQENPFINWADDSNKTQATFSYRPYQNIDVDLTALDGAVKLTRAIVWFDDGKAVRLMVSAADSDQTGANIDLVQKSLSAKLSGEPSAGQKLPCGPISVKSATALNWKTDKGEARLDKMERSFIASVCAPGKGLPPPLGAATTSVMPGIRSSELEFFVRLDSLINPAVLWTLTPDRLNKLIPNPDRMKESPHFAWTTEDKSGARFAKKIFSNTNQEILLFDDAVKAEEVLLDFKDGKANRMTISILNRGDSGGITPTQFKEYYKAAGKALGTMLGVSPRAHRVQGAGVTKTEGWIWSTPHTVATLEYNAEAMTGVAEFLRLRFAPASDRSALTNVAAIGGTKTKGALKMNVKRDNATGEVFLAGVPMVDQGQKGYCVAATCQRVFNYMGLTCDQHELASLLATSASEGTSLATMYEALSKVDSRYGAKFRTLKANKPFMRMTYKELERYQKPELIKLVKQYIDEGQPLIWAVELGRVPEKPALPQVAGGHMRLIIGYNAKNNEVIYSDSWGAGHEKKTMMVGNANQCTDALFVMEPQH